MENRERVGRSGPLTWLFHNCALIEPLLDRLDGDTTMLLFTWNVTSDPREVLDLQRLGWTADQIADFVTRSVLATPQSPCDPSG